ncbi:MAG: DUF4476 domain-containing protein [Chitinophagaceae bacterium]
MKKMLLAFICLSVALFGSAQKVFFLYMQSENQTPFYARMGDKVFSSSALGYLIIPSLRDSTYAFFIGYPGSRSNGVRFNISLKGNDRGFLVRNTGSSITLTDLQSQQVQNPSVAASGSNNQPATTRTDVFTTLLSQVSDDPSLLLSFASVVEPEQKETPLAAVKTEAPPTAPVIVERETVSETAVKEPTGVFTAPVIKDKPLLTVAAADTLVPYNVVKTEPVKNREPEVVKKDIVAETPTQKTAEVDPAPVSSAAVMEASAGRERGVSEDAPYIRSVVVRRSESSTTEGFGLVFLDNINGNTDTIRLLIPNQNIVFQRAEVVPEAPVTKGAEMETEAKPVAVNKRAPKNASLCFEATERDFLKLRRNMAAEPSDERMIGAARRYFRTRCFTSEQVRNLSGLFLTPASKYAFFDLAYPYITDRTQFPALGSEIKDEYYSKRFKALAGIE